MSECRCCHQPLPGPPLSTVELLDAVRHALQAAAEPDAYAAHDVIAHLAPGSTQRLQVAALAVRLLVMLGDPVRASRLLREQAVAEVETGWLEELWSSPAAGEPES